jgi:hypothetical protein
LWALLNKSGEAGKEIKRRRYEHKAVYSKCRKKRRYRMNKKLYRVRNWGEYNQSLVKRGSITFWFSEEALQQWKSTERSGKRGRPEKYSSVAIHCGLTLKVLLKLTFRATEGLIGSLLELLKWDLEVPDYSLLCKRQKELSLKLPRKARTNGEPLNIVVDTTGMKVYGEGEWKVRQHGTLKRRLWRKLHLAVNEKTHHIEAFELTDLGTQDCEGLPRLIEQVEGRVEQLTGDGAYDRFSCYEEAEQRGFHLITPAQRNAKTSVERPRNKKKASEGAVKKRDQVIRDIRELGRAEWKIQSRYHRRSIAETAMHRVKTLIGNRLTTRTFENQKVEMAIACQIINKMTTLGMPNSVAI